MNITVIGGGNIGTLMAAEAANKGHNVTVYTSKPYKNSIDVYDYDDNLFIRGFIAKITDNMELASKGADYIWVTVSTHVFQIISKKMAFCVKKGQKIGIIPGFGGAGLFLDPNLKRNVLF